MKGWQGLTAGTLIGACWVGSLWGAYEGGRGLAAAAPRGDNPAPASWSTSPNTVIVGPATPMDSPAAQSSDFVLKQTNNPEAGVSSTPPAGPSSQLQWGNAGNTQYPLEWGNAGNAQYPVDSSGGNLQPYGPLTPTPTADFAAVQTGQVQLDPPYLSSGVENWKDLKYQVSVTPNGLVVLVLGSGITGSYLGVMQEGRFVPLVVSDPPTGKTPLKEGGFSGLNGEQGPSSPDTTPTATTPR